MGTPLEQGWNIAAMWPLSPKADVPEHIPPAVADILREAEEARARKSRHSAGLLYGKTLDVAIKLFDQTVQGTLHSRIEQLGKAQKIAPDLAEWAMGLKGVRNYSTHEVDALELPEIEQLAETTQLILRYIFTMPERLKALKAGADP
jgi:predicted amidohydrolase YtcJ